MSETAFSNKDAAVIDEGWVEEVFCTTVKTEERVAMMEALIERGVGLAEVEHFFEGLADSCRTLKNKSRKEKLIIGTMRRKYHSAPKNFLSAPNGS